MNKFTLISSLILLSGMTLLVNPRDIKMIQLTVILVLIFFLLMSVIDIITKYILGEGAKSTSIVLVSTIYIWSTIAMNSVGSGSIKDMVIFSLVFVIAFFYVRNNFITTKR